MRTSAERGAVSTRNSSASFQERLARRLPFTCSRPVGYVVVGESRYVPSFDPVPRQRRVSITIPAGSSALCPWATAQQQIAETRCFTRRAVSRFSFQIGSKIDITCPGMTSETGSPPKRARP